VTETLTCSFGDEAMFDEGDWMEKPEAVFLHYIGRLSGVYAGTPEAQAIRDEMVQSTVVQNMAEEIIRVAGEEMIWTHALVRTGCKRAIEARKQREEQARAAERVNINDKWGRF
jgi:hypothetical protein